MMKFYLGAIAALFLASPFLALEGYAYAGLFVLALIMSGEELYKKWVATRSDIVNLGSDLERLSAKIILLQDRVSSLESSVNLQRAARK